MNILKSVLVIIKRKLDMFRYLNEFISYNGHIYVSYAIPPGYTHNYNWGDDINKDLIEMISGKKVIPYHCSLIPQTNYLCVGSILQWNSNKNAVVWGAGVREVHSIRKCKKILAVRGPLTRDVLMKQGYECPEVYGDPALLFPRYYTPTVIKKYRIGVICHFSELDNPVFKEIKANPDFHFIDVKNYGVWTNFIDEILSCEVVLSSSLHGCIISDAYKIPNLWCQFTDYIAESSGFKFVDYYQSVGKDIKSPYIFTNSPDIISVVKNRWRENSIDLDKLLKVCPFLEKS